MSYPLFFDIHAWLLGATLGFARLAPAFFLLPFFNASVLGGTLRMVVIMIVSLGFWPSPDPAMAQMDLGSYLSVLACELVIGLVLGCLLAWPFWVLHAVGNYIDNQRGATLSSTIDPANGVDTSELSNFLNIFASTIYLQGGGLLIIVQAVADSYAFYGPLHGFGLGAGALVGFIGKLVARVLVLASPVVASMLLTEFNLGLLARFAPQLNAFSVSLTVKSLVAFLVMLLYFGALLPDEVVRIGRMAVHLPLWIVPR